MEIYDQMLAAGVEIDHYESDLYVPVTPETRAIVLAYEHRSNVNTFRHSVTREAWYDIPFAYIPWWEKRSATPA